MSIGQGQIKYQIIVPFHIKAMIKGATPHTHTQTINDVPVAQW